MTPVDDMEKFLEQEKVSEVNKRIVLKYLASFSDPNNPRSKSTIENNTKIMKYILMEIKTDLDKLTIDDIDDFKGLIGAWVRKDGEPIANATKKQFLVGFKQFLRWYGKRYKNRDYIDFAEDMKIRIKLKQKTPDEILTKDEIELMIEATDSARDRAIIAVLAESGCRAGEITSSQIRHAKFNEIGVDLTFPSGKTGMRTVTLVSAAGYLRKWVEIHPNRDNPDSPLFVTTRRREVDKKSGENLDAPAIKSKQEKARDKPDEKKLVYKSLDQAALLSVVHKAAKRAGITKRVYSHLFRHTCATELSKDFTEPELRDFLGWAKSSAMPSVYVHLSGEHMKNVVMARYGIESQEKNEPKAKKCPRCKSINVPKSRFCDICGLPLAKVENDHSAVMKEISSILTKYPEVLQKVQG